MRVLIISLAIIELPMRLMYSAARATLAVEIMGRMLLGRAVSTRVEVQQAAIFLATTIIILTLAQLQTTFLWGIALLQMDRQGTQTLQITCLAITIHLQTYSIEMQQTHRTVQPITWETIAATAQTTLLAIIYSTQIIQITRTTQLETICLEIIAQTIILLAAEAIFTIITSSSSKAISTSTF